MEVLIFIMFIGVSPIFVRKCEIGIVADVLTRGKEKKSITKICAEIGAKG